MRDKISAALKVAQDEEDKRRTATLRLVQMAIKDRDAAARENGRDGVSEEDVLEILQKMVRQREKSASEFEEAGQLELAEQERLEQNIISEFLPVQIDDEEMRAICEATVKDIDAHGLRDIGRCMSTLKERYPGKMDFVQASCLMKDLLLSEPAVDHSADASKQ
ncbi:GatB/Yqey domain-containing protein [Roseibium sp. TrichSKD4]|uniref:GatB/YqeY domain-containing protein n=1 Tax=Roseibium sp. TrichSKD4 TaxID=744980 RepID=UPI0001E56964|nr:GatB/YqeY domain-containing protein [Roseibium sp. TrichSKD4]EFO31842.1 GatB/Yqey domain-containing protein [Roseibium sp. TrichSKD4]